MSVHEPFPGMPGLAPPSERHPMLHLPIHQGGSCVSRKTQHIYIHNRVTQCWRSHHVPTTGKVHMVHSINMYVHMLVQLKGLQHNTFHVNSLS